MSVADHEEMYDLDTWRMTSQQLYNMHASGGEPNRVDRLKATLPLKRGGTPEEVAAAVSWLVASESSYTTGSFIDVAGGR